MHLPRRWQPPRFVAAAAADDGCDGVRDGWWEEEERRCDVTLRRGAV